MIEQRLTDDRTKVDLRDDGESSSVISLCARVREAIHQKIKARGKVTRVDNSTIAELDALGNRALISLQFC